MTKMHFTRAAEMVKAIVDGDWTMELPNWSDPSIGYRVEVWTECAGNVSANYVRAVWTAEAFILLFREYNPRFNESKFLKACGLAS